MYDGTCSYDWAISSSLSFIKYQNQCTLKIARTFVYRIVRCLTSLVNCRIESSWQKTIWPMEALRIQIIS